MPVRTIVDDYRYTSSPTYVFDIELLNEYPKTQGVLSVLQIPASKVAQVYRTSCAKRIQRCFRRYLKLKAITLQSWWVAVSYRTGGASWEDVERQFEGEK